MFFRVGSVANLQLKEYANSTHSNSAIELPLLISPTILNVNLAHSVTNLSTICNSLDLR